MSNDQTEVLNVSNYNADSTIQKRFAREYSISATSQITVYGTLLTPITKVETQMMFYSEELFNFCKDYIKSFKSSFYLRHGHTSPLLLIIDLLLLDGGTNAEFLLSQESNFRWKLVEVFLHFILPWKAVANDKIEDILEYLQILNNVFSDDLGFHPDITPDLETLARNLLAIEHPSINVSTSLAGGDEIRLPLHLSIRAFMRRKLFHTEMGLLGVGLPGVRVGDIVVVINGCSYPVILRESEEGVLGCVK
jgi:hypothetical protein